MPDLVRPLDGRRVLDVGTALAGPVCATILAEFGAEVIKVEHPSRGDQLRYLGSSVDGVPLWFMIEGRNKKSITVDMSREAGSCIVRDLVRHCDVIVENFRPGTMQRWGLGYDDLSAINERLVYVSASGFGQTGPYSTRPAYDRVGGAMGGLTYVTGHPEHPPVKPGLGVTDYSTAITAALGTMLALYARDALGTGRGQHVDVTLAETMLRMFHYYLPLYQLTGFVPERTGNRAEAMAPADCFRARDGVWLMVAVGSDALFATLLSVVGRPELIDDPRFATNDVRTAHLVEVNAIVADWMANLDGAVALKALEDAGVPVSRLNSARDVFDDPHFRAREAISFVDDPVLGRVAMQGVVPRLGATPGRIDSTGPRLGQHTDEVLRELLGLSDDEIAALRADGIV